MMIPKEAKICPYCRKTLGTSTGVKILSVFIVIFLILFIIGLSSQTPSTPRTPPSGSDPKTATDDQIFREYEVCMSDAKKTLADDKLQGQNMIVNCFAQLSKYGDKRKRKAFKTYVDLYGY